MKNGILLFAIILALTFLSLGLFHTFHNKWIFSSEFSDAGYIGAFFSLSGVFFFCAALVYQAREYKLQVTELKASVDAQTKSSSALEKHTDLLYEQTTNALIFDMIDRFYEIKEKTEIQLSIDKFYAHYLRLFGDQLRQLQNSEPDKKKLTVAFAGEVKSVLNANIKQQPFYHDIRRVVQFSYNLFYLIDQRKIEGKRDWLTPYVYSQLSKKENLLIHLLNLDEFGGPLSDKIEWHYNVTLDFIDLLSDQASIAKEWLDPVQLLKELNLIKQRLI